jgi:hypothetical protein
LVRSPTRREDPVSAKAWRDLAAESELSAEAYPAELVKRLIVIGCAAEGARYVVGALTEQLDDRFRGNSTEQSAVAPQSSPGTALR